MRAIVAFICAFTFFASVTVSAARSDEALLSAETRDDLAYRAALFNYHTGNYLDGLMGLSYSNRNDSTKVYREVLAGRLNLELKRYAAAQQAFDNLKGKNVPYDLSKNALFPLAKLSYVKGRCDVVLQALNDIRGLPKALDFNARFMRASCMVDQNLRDDNVLQKAEKVLLDAINNRDEPSEHDIWFSYGYYNIAIAAGILGKLDEADRLYQEALKYTGVTHEGRELANRIRISHGYANYEANRFDFAMNTFAQLPLDGYWADASLLGFGWAAFHNYSPGLALESWRQLVNLPYKSISVYEGYIAIPFALERSNAFSDAWIAYKNAIKEYTIVVTEIDKLSKSLNAKKITEHAIEYYEAKGQRIEPLHPLIAATYAQDEFRELIERVGEVRYHQERLDSFIATLDIHQEVRSVERNSRRMSNRELKRRQKSIERALNRIEKALPKLADELLANEISKPNVDANLKSKYQEFKRLQGMLSQSAGKAAREKAQQRLDRLKGVLIGQLYQASRDEFGHLEAVTRLTNTYQQLGVRYESYKKMREADYKPVVKDVHLSGAKIKIKSIKKESSKVLANVQQELLEKTLNALDEQKQRILVYRYQARIAKTRLEEEFFQRGARQL